MNVYEEKQAARKERLEARADRLDAVAAAQFRKADPREEASGIPFGQPILVGHHSEGKHRRAIARQHAAMGKGIEASKAADAARYAAEGVGSGGISADDPDALAKLRAKLAEAQEAHAGMVAANRAAGRGGVKPYAAYQLANSNGRMKQVKDRIAGLEKAAQRQHVELEGPDGARVVQNVEANRVQIIFPGKPDADVRAKLKGLGFRWAPSENAWQRHLNNAGVYAARAFLKGE